MEDCQPGDADAGGLLNEAYPALVMAKAKAKEKERQLEQRIMVRGLRNHALDRARFSNT